MHAVDLLHAACLPVTAAEQAQRLYSLTALALPVLTQSTPHASGGDPLRILVGSTYPPGAQARKGPAVRRL